MPEAAFTRLPLMDPARSYLCALVLVPSEEVCALVRAARLNCPVAQAAADPPHVTLLFLGRIQGAQAVQLQTALHKAGTLRFETETDGLGVFSRADVVNNLHVRLKPHRELADAHRTLLKHARQFEWFCPGHYVESFYTPHISIYNAMNLAEADAKRIVENLHWDDVLFSLSDPHIRVVPIAAGGP
jgi:2'-5' RNA ligase